ncbi:MAG: ferritin-like domain-containing protein [Peptococcaceae bacterium]|nr:ferritin-like domain-containing protein [Peptococcaceae bacterium]
MDKEQLISRLNWFYSLELNQVDLYKSQSKAFENEYAGLVFEQLSSIEQGHVENIGIKIKELGEKPTTIGDVLSPFIGHIAGKILGSRDLPEVLKINTMIEQKAMKDYKGLIEDLKNSDYGSGELIKILQNNFIDENLHTEWFKTKLSELQTVEFSLIP